MEDNTKNRIQKSVFRNQNLKVLCALSASFACSAVILEAAEWHAGALGENGLTIDARLTPEYKAAKVWHPKPGDPKVTESRDARIVAYSDKWTRHGMGDFGAKCMYRDSQSPLSPYDKEKNFPVFQDTDVDGDGKTENDFIKSIPFSMDLPFNIEHWPASGTFPEPNSGFYSGGWSIYYGNTPVKNFKPPEMGINYDHSPPFFDSRAEDHPINGLADSKTKGAFINFYAAYVWKKEHFLNCRPEDTVSFDPNSYMASLCTRGYWQGWDDTHMIVEEGGKLYMSDIEQFDLPKEYSYRPYPGRLFYLEPLKAKWAEYNPKGHLMKFDPKTAKYEAREFKDITAVGWYLAKNSSEGPAQAHCKWYGFGAGLKLTGSKVGSVNFEMPKIKGAGGVSEFYMTNCEIPYLFYKKIYRFGNAPFHQVEPRFVYMKDGDMGSMQKGMGRHSQEEPVTNMAWYDILSWCNTWSAYEGRTPCYYIDPEFKQVFRNDHIMTRAKKKSGGLNSTDNPEMEVLPEPKIYVKWDADGFRLPTVAEWDAAAGGNLKSEISNLKSAEGTSPVGKGKPNENGLYDMIGNIWEPVWTYDDCYDPERDKVTVVGGDFYGKSDPKTTGASVHGEIPWQGAHNIGIRAVRRDAGLKKPEIASKGDHPQWVFNKTEVVKGADQGLPKESAINMLSIPAGSFKRTEDKLTVKVNKFYMGETPVTYAQWREVKQWAEANGYSFSTSGQMGSMFYFHFEHSPEEPVTAIQWQDAIVWCNALSEKEGKKPFYYLDPKFTEVYRKAYCWKPIKFDVREYMKSTESNKHWAMNYMASDQGQESCPWLFEKWDVDGYRMATASEWEYALKAGSKGKYFWGNDEAMERDYVWGIKYGGGRTHPVKTKKPNAFGLYGMQGHVLQFTNSANPGRVSRSMRLDLDNPKHSFFSWYGLEKNRKMQINICYGGSSVFWSETPLSNNEAIFQMIEKGLYFYDCGFRVVRCDAGTHPVDGNMPMLSPIQVSTKPEEFNPLSE